jgi:hypothetical protein
MSIKLNFWLRVAVATTFCITISKSRVSATTVHIHITNTATKHFECVHRNKLFLQNIRKKIRD